MKPSKYILLLLIAACSYKKGPLENQTMEGHRELYSEPSAPRSPEVKEDLNRIVIAATNDVQGNYRARTISFEDKRNDDPQAISIGGVGAISSYFKILRDNYKNVLLVDSGDVLSDLNLKFTQNFYSRLGYDALTVGTGDFNLKLPPEINSNAELFKNLAKKSNVPLILSNLFELKTGRVVEWEGTKPYLIKEISGIKVGILGLVPNDITSKTPVNNRVGFFVENMLQTTLRHARLMRSLGADLIVVLTHQGIDCTNKLAEESRLPEHKVNFDPLRPDVCDLSSPLGEYLERLPPHLVDVVVGGRLNKKTANYVNGTLVLSSYEDGQSFSHAELFLDPKSKKFLPERTIVHQPVFFCHEFFEETNDCFHEDKSVNHKRRIPATFLGKPIKVDSSLEKKFPELNLRNTSAQWKNSDVKKSLTTYEADITYLPKTSGVSQLMVLNVKGSTLSRMLEQDYNESTATSWFPSPYLAKGEELQILISGLALDPAKTYKVLTDLDAIGKNAVLLFLMSKVESRIHSKESWNAFLDKSDSVNTTVAAPQRK